MNVAIYARVSTDVQAEHGYSLGAQVEDCTQKAKEMGATMIKEYVDDGYSGAYLERPALSEMREAVRQKLFQAVICYDVDRLSRNLSHQLLITDDIENSGATLVFVKSDYKNTAEGKLFYAVKGAFAGYEREKIKERTARGRLAMLRQGKAIQDSHVYGYDFDKENHAYIVNPFEASVLRKMFDLYLNGHGGVGAVAQWLNERLDEYPPPRGNAWGRSVVRDMLRREMYTGKYYSNRIYHMSVGLKGEKRIERPREEWVEMHCPAIITEEQHKEAVQLLKTNRKRDYHKNRHPYLLQGIAYCGVCGRRLSIRQSKGVSRYVCYINGDVENKHPSKCGFRSAICAAVDEAFWEILQAICKSPTTLKKYIQQSQPTKVVKDNTAKREAKLEKIKSERKAIMAWFSSQLITQEEATEKLEALKKAENKLLQENIPIAPRSPQMDYQAVCEAVSVCAKNAHTRHALVRKLVEKVVFMRTDNRSGVQHYKLDMQIFFR